MQVEKTPKKSERFQEIFFWKFRKTRVYGSVGKSRISTHFVNCDFFIVENRTTNTSPKSFEIKKANFFCNKKNLQQCFDSLIFLFIFKGSNCRKTNAGKRETKLS